MDREIQEFFDKLAPGWDAREPAWARPVIDKILDRIAPCAADAILDVGCGTGVLFPFLRERGVKRYMGLDCSGGMLAEFAAKFPDAKTETGDYQSQELFTAASFTKVIIYNTFPHFTDPKAVFGNSWRYLKSGGGLYIVHSMNREALDLHHKNAGAQVEDHVLEPDSMLRSRYLQAGFEETEIENGDCFYSCGFKP